MKRLSKRAETMYLRALDEIHSMADAAREKLGVCQPREDRPISLKIVSDGLAHNTQVIDIESGRPIGGITAIKWSVSVQKMVASVSIDLTKIPVDIEARQDSWPIVGGVQ